jgi:hypothetical protein
MFVLRYRLRICLDGYEKGVLTARTSKKINRITIRGPLFITALTELYFRCIRKETAQLIFTFILSFERNFSTGFRNYTW